MSFDFGMFFSQVYHLIGLRIHKNQTIRTEFAVKLPYKPLAGLVSGGKGCVNRVDDFHNCLLTTFADPDLSQIIVLVTFHNIL